VNMHQVRHPRLQVLADGIPLEGAYEARVESNNYYRPDRFSLRLVRGERIINLPDSLTLPESATFTISVRLDRHSDLVTLLVGQGDTSTCDYVSRGIRIDGRDLSAPLQDTPSSDAFSNKTSSEIATILAARHNLIPLVSATDTLVGRYYHGDNSQTAFNQFSRSSTEWDLLAYLARCEGFDVFVAGRTLYFQPTVPTPAIGCLLRPDDLISLRLRRRLRLSGDITVTVKSWDSQQSSAIVQSAVSRRLSYASAVGPLGAAPAQQYYLIRPNLRASDAAAIAKSRVDELSRHEQCIELTMPGELMLTARSSFLLEGTDSDFDQVYQIDAIERVISTTSGFTQRISAHSVSSRQTTLSSNGA
jgi:phage protein D